MFGDFHGNMADLSAFAKLLWPLGMHLTPGSFLFLGDYVDRGQYSIEVLSYLFAQKIMLPDKVFMLRGNHELRAVNISFCFFLINRVSLIPTVGRVIMVNVVSLVN